MTRKHEPSVFTQHIEEALKSIKDIGYETGGDLSKAPLLQPYLKLERSLPTLSLAYESQVKPIVDSLLESPDPAKQDAIRKLIDTHVAERLLTESQPNYMTFAQKTGRSNLLIDSCHACANSMAELSGSSASATYSLLERLERNMILKTKCIMEKERTPGGRVS